MSILGLGRDAKRALTASLFGFLLDAYDLLIILSVLPLIQVIFFPELTGILGLLATYGTLSISLLFRPLGSSLFGFLADRIGRRKVLILTVLGFALSTALIGLLPTYDQAGILAPILLYIVRAVQGIFVGGEYAAGNPFALEFSPRNRRGLVSGLLSSSFDAGVLLSSLVVFIISSMVSKQDFIAYGWRIAFFTGLIPAVLALYVRFAVPESKVWEMRRKAILKLDKIGTDSSVNYRLIIATSLLMAGFLYTYYSTIGFYSTLVANYLKYPSPLPSLILTITNAILLVAHLGAGALSDWMGRRKGLILFGITSIVVALLVFIMLPSIAFSFNNVLISLALAGALTNAAYGIHAAYVTESFPTLRRGLGYGISYAIGLIIGAAAPFILILLGNAIGSIFIAIIINVVLGQLMVVTVAISRPETKDLSIER